MTTAIMTTRQVAELFGVNAQTVIVWANAGRLPHFRTLGGHRRYLVADVEALRSSQTAAAGDAA